MGASPVFRGKFISSANGWIGPWVFVLWVGGTGSSPPLLLLSLRAAPELHPRSHPRTPGSA